MTPRTQIQLVVVVQTVGCQLSPQTGTKASKDDENP